jgi:hypothetical protein
MADPNSDLQSKINRAVRAVLIDRSAATLDNCYAAPCSDARKLPNTTITTGDGVPFGGPGDWQFPDVMLNLRDDATVQINVADSATPRVSANERCTKICNALNRSDDEHTLDFMARELTRLGNLLAVDQSGGADPAQVQSALDNADMADFGVIFWQCELNGTPTKHDENTTFWERELGFSCVAMNRTVS